MNRGQHSEASGTQGGDLCGEGGTHPFESTFAGRRVLVTGHTGFIGSWLSEWLLLLGAKVTGLSLAEPPSQPSLFEELGLRARLASDDRADIRDLDAVVGLVSEARPEFLFHLAAQPIVRRSFESPHLTVTTNALGTLNVLEALKRGFDDPSASDHRGRCVAVMVTTDKVYENREWLCAYREHDKLGGRDPYSASKACAEILIAAFRDSFFGDTGDSRRGRVALASARGGNVLGGGDWSVDRILPDAMRSFSTGKPLTVRNPDSTRPWQHVLDLVGGLLLLGARLDDKLRDRELNSDTGNRECFGELCGAYNFGPLVTSNLTVAALVAEIRRHWPGDVEMQAEVTGLHEAGRLNLAIDRAYHLLNWAPRWNFAETVARTVGWYKRFYEAENRTPDTVRQLVDEQIAAYSAGT